MLAASLLWGLLPVPPAPQEAAVAPPLPSLAERVDRAIDRGVERLIQDQYPDGSWTDWYAQEYPAGPTALAVYALFKSGLPPEHRAIRLGLEFLRLHEPTQTYDAAVRCLLLSSLDPERYAARIERAADVMIDHHAGRFDYVRVLPNTPSGDLSNTQFAMVALEALDRHGFQRDDKFWEKMADYLARDQDREGGFPYHPGGVSTLTMTIGGYCCLAACARVLERRGARAATLEPIRAAMARAESWLAPRWLADQEWNGENALHQWGYYAWYGVERAAALAAAERIAGRDWYREGAEILVARQNGGGDWTSAYGRPAINTAFALLTLSRSTAQVGTGGTPRRGLWELRWSNADAGRADLLITASGAPTCQAFLAGFHPELVELYTFPGEHWPRVTRFAWLLDGTELTVDRPAEPAALAAASAAPRWPIQFALRENGDYRLEARAWLRLPTSEDPNDLVEVRSGPLGLRVHGLTTPADLDQIRWLEGAQAVDVAGGAPLSASSQESGDYNGAQRAFDRCQGSRWLAERNDLEPWLRLVPKRPLKVAAIRLLPAMEGPRQAGFDLPQRVQLTINGRKHELALDPKDVLRGTFFALGRPLRLRELEVRVIERRASTNPNLAGLVGFREIQLLESAP